MLSPIQQAGFQISSIPQHPGQMIQNARGYVQKKEFATWNLTESQMKPKSRERELQDLLLVGSLNRNSYSITQRSQVIKPTNKTNKLQNNYDIPIHPQYQNFSPLPLSPNYLINQITPNHAHMNYFPNINYNNRFLSDQVQKTTLNNQQETYRIVENNIQKQQDYENKIIQLNNQQNYLQQQLQQYRQSDLNTNELFSERIDFPRYYQIPYNYQNQKIIQPIKYTVKEKKNKQRAIKLQIIKELQELKLIKQGAQLEDSRVSSEPSIQEVQKPRRQRIKPPQKPQYIDIQEDQKQLKQLFQQKYSLLFKKYCYAIIYLNRKKQEIIDFVKNKKKDIENQLPQLQFAMIKQMEEQSKQILTNLFTIITQQKYNLRIVNELPKIHLNPKQIQINIKNLKTITQQYITDIIKSIELNDQSILYFSKIVNDNNYLLSGQHLQFELNRLNFTKLGALIKMTIQKQKMMLAINLWIKTLIIIIYQSQEEKQDEISITNLKSIISIIYEIILQFAISQGEPIPNNIKDVPQENIVKPKNENYLTLKKLSETSEEIQFLQQLKQQKSDQPLLYPYFTSREIAQFLDNERTFISEMISLIDGQITDILAKIETKVQDQKSQYIQSKKQQNEKIEQQYLNPIQKTFKLKYQERKTNYLKWNQEIKYLKEKIQKAQIQNDEMKKTYEQNVQTQKERQQEIDKLAAYLKS